MIPLCNCRSNYDEVRNTRNRNLHLRKMMKINRQEIVMRVSNKKNGQLETTHY